jgi:hypothetical protein
MSIRQNAKIQIRHGLQENLPQLDTAELGYSLDTQQVWIGNGNVADGAPVPGVTEILTSVSLQQIINDLSNIATPTVVSVTLEPGITAPTPTGIVISTAITKTGYWNYSLSNNGFTRSGQLEFAFSNANVSWTDSFTGDVTNVDLTVVANGDAVEIYYTSGNISNITLLATILVEV